MNKTILITGSTDGIGLLTAKTLASKGNTILLHGRSQVKLDAAKKQVADVASNVVIETYCADLSILANVKTLAQQISEKHQHLDVIVNNAGVYVVPETHSKDGLDVRFAVNTIAPYLLTKLLMPILDSSSRVVNLSSAAQAPINPDEIMSPSQLSDGVVYARSKLALTMWTHQIANLLNADGPVIVSVNPASMLGSKMVKDAYGVAGGDLQRGADILVDASLSDAFSNASGKYYDNDIGRFTQPHPDALDPGKGAKLIENLNKIIAKYL